jgi:archaellum component FlaC
MQDDQIDDLKQFITTTVSQQLTDFEQRLNGRIDGLEKKMDEGFAGVGDAISEINDKIENHDTRLTNLESAQA